MFFTGALDGFVPPTALSCSQLIMNTSQAICRMREVIRRQHKALSTEEYLFYRDILGQPSVAACGPHRSLPVVPLIADKRYYGEAPGKIRWGYGRLRPLRS